MDRRTKVLGVAVMMLAAATVVVAACDDGAGAVKEPMPGGDSGITPGVDSGGPGTKDDGGTLPDGAPRDCVLDPKTHEEIINGCTDAVRITKNPTLPLLYPDGGLPPLP